MILRNSKADEIYDIILSMIKNQIIEEKFLLHKQYCSKSEIDLYHALYLSEAASIIYIRDSLGSIFQFFVNDSRAESYEEFFKALTKIQRKYFAFNLDLFYNIE